LRVEFCRAGKCSCALADPGKDAVGQAIDARNLPKRIRLPRTKPDRPSGGGRDD